ncbi:MAG: sarcosine oxidase subunit alpha [Arenicella sp.]|jgi:sarcosine oxidase subunit alpha
MANTKLKQRLAAPYGLLIDSNMPLSFSFEGQSFDGFEGDTIASALLANDQWLISRSFKYHRARGPLTMAGQDANTLVQLPSAPNTLADKCALESNMSVMGQNYKGSLARDLQAYIGLLSRFLPVGFYYKAFFRPRGIWEAFWGPFIRKQSGLGNIDQSLIPAYHDKQYKFADVLVVGAGPAGLTAALAAAKQGLEVILVDENPVLGGCLNYARFNIDNSSAKDLLKSLLSKVTAADNIEIMLSTTANSWHADNWLALITDNRLYKVRAKELIVCAGSLEQQAIFRGNDIPGVVMSSAALRMMHLYGVKPGQNTVVVSGNDDGYMAALELLDAGVKVVALVDMRDQDEPLELANLLKQKGCAIHQNSTVYEAFIDKRKHRVSRVEVRSIKSQGQVNDDPVSINCDLVCMAVGYMPTYQLVCQASGQLSYDDNSCKFSLSNYPNNFEIAGSVNGYWDLNAVVADALNKAQKCIARLQGTLSPELVAPSDTIADHINFSWPMFEHPKGKEFVDYDEDLQIKDIVNATSDGYEHIQLVKRYSTCGMGPSQGRHSALAAARLVADATNRTVAETGVTTARPPFASETLAHNAGRQFYPARRTSIHYRHIEQDAQMMLAGAWYRPAYYGPTSNSKSLIDAEVTNVRNNVGIVDVSTLGGLEVRGPDAAVFLERFYTFAFAKQPIGRARYALLTNEAGVVIDDGVACRFHQQHFYVTATTGGVDQVFQSMLKWNAQWALDVDIANATTAWCAVNIAGPNARKVLAKLCEDIDLSADAFPYMGVRQGRVADIPARLIRVGFVGELGFEIHVPHQYGEALWDALLAAGEEHKIRPFGVEAQRILRLEKGHIIIGQDTDAMSNPMEVQMSWAIARKKPFFVGARTIRELEKIPQQRVLVGFSISASDGAMPDQIMPKESHLVLEGEQMTGRVTSCNYSPTLKKIIGLAYVPLNKAPPNSVVEIKCDQGIRVSATVVRLPFYDPDNQQQEL